MSTTRLYRWSGIVLLIGGLIGIIGLVLDTIFFPDHNLTAQQTLSTAFTIDGIFFVAWSILLTLGLPGLYLRQAARAGKLGFAGFVLVWLSLLLGGVAFGIVQATMYPYLAQSAPKLLPTGGVGPDSGFILWIFLPVLLLSIGTILLGIATRRARVFPGWTGTLLIISGVLFLLSIPPLPAPFGTIIDLASNGTFYVALAWCGYQLMTQRSETVETAQSALQVGAIR
ncbi:MAG TPA: hypothetical protein VKV20_07925 [Ktedonobacteraceae bacterium]|jgi:hypothetical protein|nr:hypothetical protein [Ktedonobacteraceae bacterium]